MKIIKYCEKRYGYLKADKIQIGTLDYYRKHDSKFIADPNEGTGGPYSIEPKSSSATLSKNIMEQFGGGIKRMRDLPNTPIITVKPGGVVKLNKRFKFPNVYIFCCSYEECADIKTAKGLGYDSWYEIIEPEIFMREIENGFSEVAKTKFKGCIEIDAIRIHGAVNYNSRENQVFESEFDLATNLLFTKPKVSERDSSISYENNKEYRFVWLFKDKYSDMIVDVEESPILVENSNALKKILR